MSIEAELNTYNIQNKKMRFLFIKNMYHFHWWGGRVGGSSEVAGEGLGGTG